MHKAQFDWLIQWICHNHFFKWWYRLCCCRCQLISSFYLFFRFYSFRRVCLRFVYKFKYMRVYNKYQRRRTCTTTIRTRRLTIEHTRTHTCTMNNHFGWFRFRFFFFCFFRVFIFGLLVRQVCFGSKMIFTIERFVYVLIDTRIGSACMRAFHLDGIETFHSFEGAATEFPSTFRHCRREFSRRFHANVKSFWNGHKKHFVSLKLGRS